MSPRLGLLGLALLFTTGPARAAEPLPVRAGGLALGAVGLHAGSGEHPLAPALGGWVRTPLGSSCFLEPELAGARRREGGSLASIDLGWARAAVGLGCATGTRAVKVAASLGPAISYRWTAVSAEERWRAASLAPGLRYRAGFLLPVGPRMELDILAGGSTHGLVFEHDLMLQGGVRW